MFTNGVDSGAGTGVNGFSLKKQQHIAFLQSLM